MSRILQRQTGVDIPVAVGGDGIYVIDKAGRRYVDATGGPSVACLGHGDPDVRRAVSEQMEKISYVSNQFFTTEVAEELADILIAGAPAGLVSVVYTCGGSEAVETAMKMARQYYVESGEPGRHRFIARRQSYHGATLGALAVGGHAARRAAYEPMLMKTSHIAPCYAYRGMGSGESEDDYGRRVADELEAEIEELGPETVAAFFAETVVGAALGAVPPVPGYFRRIREICDRHGVLLVLDEIMSGMGRTGTLHACEQEGVSPDLMIVAKGLGAGYQPIGAVLVGGKIVEAIAAGSGTLLHGLTYMAHPVGCAAALAVQHAIRDRDLLANVRRQGAVLRDALQDRFGNHRHVGDIRGRGLFWGIELVADRGTKAPFDAELGLNARVKAEGMARGLICYPISGTVDGTSGDVVMVSPPFIVSETQVGEIVELVGETVDAALAGVTGR
jgi:adenosylmethionine-8-amino-7-oxononanoate aminotransferase